MDTASLRLTWRLPWSYNLTTSLDTWCDRQSAVCREVGSRPKDNGQTVDATIIFWQPGRVPAVWMVGQRCDVNVYMLMTSITAVLHILVLFHWFLHGFFATYIHFTLRQVQPDVEIGKVMTNNLISANQDINFYSVKERKWDSIFRVEISPGSMKTSSEKQINNERWAVSSV